jgi:hypothetical protein
MHSARGMVNPVPISVSATTIGEVNLLDNKSALSSYSGTVKHPYPIVDMIDQVVLAVK